LNESPVSRARPGAPGESLVLLGFWRGLGCRSGLGRGFSFGGFGVEDALGASAAGADDLGVAFFAFIDDGHIGVDYAVGFDLLDDFVLELVAGFGAGLGREGEGCTEEYRGCDEKFHVWWKLAFCPQGSRTMIGNHS